MSDAEKYSLGGNGTVSGVIPTRSPILNYVLGGGIPLNAVTTVYGKEGSYKTTFLIEMIAQAQQAGGLVYIASNEDSVKRDRVTAIGGRGNEFPLMEHAPPDVILTIEFVRSQFKKYFNDKREEDFKAAVAQIRSGKCKAALLDYYVKLLGIAKKYARDTEYIANHISPKRGTGLHHAHLHPDHKRIILFGLDSGTACPSQDGYDGSKSNMNEAQAWTSFFKYIPFIDNKSALIIVNQMRTKISKQFQTWEDEAAPSATFFHAYIRLNFMVPTKNVLRCDRDGVVKLHEDNKDGLPVGAILRVTVRKNKRTGIDGVSIPHVMWKQTGTDTPWTIFQLLLDNGVIVNDRGLYGMLFIGKDGKTPEKVQFRRKDFYTKVYSDPILQQQLLDQTKTLLQSLVTMPQNTLRYGETHDMEYEGHIDTET